MPLNSSGIYIQVTGATTAFSGQVIASATWNAIFADLGNAFTGVCASGAIGGTGVTLANGLNSNISTSSIQFLRIVGPSAAFSLGGFVQLGTYTRLTVYNSVSQTMTIVNEDVSSTNVNRIKTLTGGNVVLRTTAPSSATFVYDITDGRWILTATN